MMRGKRNSPASAPPSGSTVRPAIGTEEELTYERASKALR